MSKRNKAITLEKPSLIMESAWEQKDTLKWTSFVYEQDFIVGFWIKIAKNSLIDGYM